MRGKTVETGYGVSFGKCDSSDWVESEVELTDGEVLVYDSAVEKKIPL